MKEFMVGAEILYVALLHYMMIEYDFQFQACRVSSFLHKPSAAF